MQMNLIKSGSRSIELDFVRGIAILLVIGYHALVYPTNIFLFRALEFPGKQFGFTGVDLFFVLSGFLVGGLLLKEYHTTGQIQIRRFITRRAFKIWPPYFAYILFQIVTHHFPLHTFLLQNLLQIQNYTGTTLAHTWTLSLEEHFYLILVLGLGWMAKKHWEGRKLLTTFFITCIVIILTRSLTIYLGDPKGAIYYTHNRLDSLLVGVMLATVSTFYPQAFEALTRRLWPLAGLSLLLLLLLCTPHVSTAWAYFNAFYAYLGYAAFMLLLFRHSDRLSKTLPYRAIAWIGVYSYSIYLWHVAVRHPCFNLAARFSEPWRWPIAMSLQYFTAILLGAAMARLIERPFLLLRDRFAPNKGGALQSMDAPPIASEQQYVPLQGRGA